MFRRLLPAICGPQAYRKVPCGQVAVCKQLTRNSVFARCEKSEIAIPTCQWSKLENGMRVITEETSGPLACVTLVADAGSRFETIDNNGICHFLEHIICSGFEGLYGGAFDEHLKKICARFTVHTGRDHQAFIFTCPQDEVQNMINFFPRLFFEVECNIEDVKRELFNVQQQLIELESNSKQLCFDYLHQTAFQGTPLALAPLGRFSNYMRFGKCFLQSFIAAHYQPSRLVMSVSSVHSHDDVKNWVQVAFMNVCQTCLDCKVTPCRYTGSMTRFRNDSMPFCHVALAVETKGYGSDHYEVLQLMKHIIGRWDERQAQGYETWPMLAHACAISKLCHAYEAFYLPYRDVGLWGVYFVIKKEDDYEDIIVMIQDQWMKLCTSTTRVDVQRAAAAMKLEMARAVNGCVASCMDMGLQMLYTCGRYNLLNLYMKIDNLNGDDVRKVADSIIYDRCPVISAIGPTEALPDYNRIRSGMHWLRS